MEPNRLFKLTPRISLYPYIGKHQLCDSYSQVLEVGVTSKKKIAEIENSESLVHKLHAFN